MSVELRINDICQKNQFTRWYKNFMSMETKSTPTKYWSFFYFQNVNHENSVASHRLAQDDNQEMINKELSTVKSDEINVGKALDIIKQYLGKNSTDNELLEKIVSEVDKKIDEKERKKLKK